MSQVCAERDRFVAFAFAGADVLVETDDVGTVTYATGALGRFLPADAATSVGHSFAELIGEQDRPLWWLLFEEIRNGGRRGPIALASSTNGAVAECAMIRMPGTGHVRLTLRGMAQSRPALPPDASDPATGLLRPEAFADLAEREFLRMLETDQDLELSLVRLVGLEDVAGGLVGAKVQDFLKQLAAALRATSLAGGSAACLGPGQFAFVRPSGADVRRLDRLFERTLADQDLAAVQVARHDLALRDPSISPTQACAAMRHALKRFEKDGSTTFDRLADALSQRLSDTAVRVQNAKAVIDTRNFFVVYQPIVGLADGMVHHHEALARLTTRDEQIFDFVTFAEEIGFIVDFDLAVAREVLQKLADLRRQRRHPHVAVNLSARSLQTDRFVDRLLQLCSSGSAASQLLFEVTESFQLIDLDHANNVIQALRRQGHQVCLDDFGAGAAAFHYIKSLQVDYVKLDGVFVQRSTDSDRDAAVLRSMVELCRSLEVKVIAEMVETQATAQALTTLGVDLAQGFLYGRACSDLV